MIRPALEITCDAACRGRRDAMFARLTRITAAPDRVDQFEPIVREQVLPAAKQMAGFRGMYAMIDRQGGNALSFTLWESEEAMRTSEAAADRLRSESAAQGGAEIEAVERYEVILQPD
jgi:heme-degrading monooxygenase HmoA